MTTLLALDIGCWHQVGWGIVEAGDTYGVTERGSIPTDAMRGGRTAGGAHLRAASVLISHPSVSGVAVASAGVVNPATGDIVSATGTMPGWEHPPRQPPGAATGLRARPQRRARPRSGRSTSALTLRTVLSIAVVPSAVPVEDRQVSFGARGVAGHVGISTTTSPRREHCSCGRKGPHRVLLLRDRASRPGDAQLRGESDPSDGARKTNQTRCA